MFCDPIKVQGVFDGDVFSVSSNNNSREFNLKLDNQGYLVKQTTWIKNGQNQEDLCKIDYNSLPQKNKNEINSFIGPSNSFEIEQTAEGHFIKVIGPEG